MVACSMRSATTSATSLSRSDRLEAVLVGAIEAAHGLLAMLRRRPSAHALRSATLYSHQYAS